jgi:CBS domain-containing protein
MAHVSDILSQKGGDVYTVARGVSVLDATHRMNAHSIGAVVVTDERGHVDGIFTERDVLRRVVGKQRDAESTTVAQVMTTEVVCCSAKMEVEDVRALMTQRRIRHLPVVDDDGKLVGLVSIGDINAHFANSHEVQLQHLREYISGRG